MKMYLLLLNPLFQMDLQQKFEATTSGRIVPVNTLTAGVAYNIYAERVTTKFGPSVVLTLVTKYTRHRESFFT
jgi:hypothetical protein